MKKCLVCGIKIPDWYPIELCDVCGGLKTTPLSSEDSEVLKKDFKIKPNKFKDVLNKIRHGASINLSTIIDTYLSTPYDFNTHMEVLKSMSTILCTGFTIYSRGEFLDDLDDLDDLEESEDLDSDLFDDISDRELESVPDEYSELFDSYDDLDTDDLDFMDVDSQGCSLVLTLDDILDICIANLPDDFKWEDIRNN